MSLTVKEKEESNVVSQSLNEIINKVEQQNIEVITNQATKLLSKLGVYSYVASNIYSKNKEKLVVKNKVVVNESDKKMIYELREKQKAIEENYEDFKKFARGKSANKIVGFDDGEAKTKQFYFDKFESQLKVVKTKIIELRG